MSKEEPGNSTPKTIMDIFEEAVIEKGDEECIFTERYNKWISFTWNQYHKQVINFAKAVISLGVDPYQCVNIAGFNSPEWLFSCLGAMYACTVSVGVYPTNNAETCFYIAEHSDCGVLVVDSIEQYKKYEPYFPKLKRLKAVVFWGEIRQDLIKSLANPYLEVYSWDEFIAIGKKSNCEQELTNRIQRQKPGNVCNIVYTSGTTGFPKGVLLSYDSLIFISEQFPKVSNMKKGLRFVSFLPLSHIAAQIFDIFILILLRHKIYFCRPDALQGSLIKTLLYVKPEFFWAVPRVFEKFEEQIRKSFLESSSIKKRIIKFSRDKGKKYFRNLNENVEKGIKNIPYPIGYTLANNLLFKKIRKTLGFEYCEYFFYGAAPMKKKTLDFFFTLGWHVKNAYGLSESSGGCVTNCSSDVYSVGKAYPGTEVRIKDIDSEGLGEICLRGRHSLMGYFKNEEATIKAIDNERFFHTGDQGYIDKNGNLFITGRLKELIITAGGENIAPLPIEDVFKENCLLCSQAVIIGEQRKFLTILITLKTDPKGILLSENKVILQQIGSEVTNIKEAINCPRVKEYINSCLKETNKKAVSRAQVVQKYCILMHDFSIDSGEFTPTLKLKRSYVNKKYAKEIEEMYMEAKF